MNTFNIVYCQCFQYLKKINMSGDFRPIPHTAFTSHTIANCISPINYYIILNNGTVGQWVR